MSILTKDPDGKKSIDFGVYGIPETIIVNKDLISTHYTPPITYSKKWTLMKTKCYITL